MFWLTKSQDTSSPEDNIDIGGKGVPFRKKKGKV